MTKPLALVYYERLMPGTQLVNRLQDLGYRVLTLTEPSLLIDTARKERPIVALIDLVTNQGEYLFDHQGDERRQRNHGHIPVVGFAAQKDQKLHTDAARAGATLVAYDDALLPQLPHLLEHALRVEFKRNQFMAPLPVKLTRGIHVMHLFYRIDRPRWKALVEGEAKLTLERLQRLCEANSALQSAPCHVCECRWQGRSGVHALRRRTGSDQPIHRSIERSFPAGTLQSVYSFLSVTELPEYVTTEDDMLRNSGRRPPTGH